jgi:hypothetical protein
MLLLSIVAGAFRYADCIVSALEGVQVARCNATDVSSDVWVPYCNSTLHDTRDRIFKEVRIHKVWSSDLEYYVLVFLKLDNDFPEENLVSSIFMVDGIRWYTL